MKLTSGRISRYLQKIKKLNDYLLKITSKSRAELILLSEARSILLKGEEALRNLSEKLVK